ncbi:MAG: AAA family ATPase, partial [bacterium]|nr:AAA family ATPase [bacterium]
MIHLPGYRVHEQLYKSGDVTIYRGTGDKENTPVVIKLLDKEYPTEEQLARLRREYKITRSLSGDGIIRAYSLEKYGNSLAIILEDFGGRPLEKILSQYQPAPDEKLALAISMAEALALVHRQNIAHKDINPANFLLNRETMQVKIIDFGIATELPRENPEIRNPNVLEGTLAYLSPEQTGRMNRAMDYRTDMYSLGVTYYELFTGQLPFKTDDAMEMVHCHIAKTPGSPERINPEIPGPVSRIIMKLLSKTAEERYQNTMGIVHDLNVCLDKLQSTGEITEFHIGQHDISDRFRIPQKLYGREQEIAAMHAAFNRTGEGAKEMILVAGEPGIGKSALVHEVTRSITEKRGHFITGKFEQLKRDIPYAAFLQAFRELVKSLLAESEERLLALKEKLILALGPSGQVIIDVIPEVELIIGEQPAVGELDPTRAGNRFELVFQNFVRVFANKESPLVIFIDDLQWTDLPSLKLIELFMTDEETRYLLIIGAYRDNEVGLSHPLPMLLKGLLEAGCTADTISLRPLELKFISELLAETLLCHPDAAYALADLCAQKTLGNPFFLNRLLYSLYEEHLIDFDAQEGIWTYDIIEIKDVGITDNVVELMVEKIRKLDPDTQAIIILAACIGNQFHLDTLVVVSELTKNETAQHLSRILQENLAAPTDDSYKFMLESRGDLTAGFRFLHDRIQQAAYSLISEERKKEVHLKIGRLLLSTVPEKDLDDTIFNIANHLNLGSELIRDQFEKDTLAELNLRAGQKAKISAAYKPAYDYFKTGIALVTVSPWTRKYDLCRLLHEEGAEAEYLSGEYEESEKILSALMANAITIPHRLKGEEIRILTYMSRGRFKETIDASLDILRLLGEKFPAEPKKRHILAELIRVKLALSGKTDEQLLSAGEITDPVILAKGRILCRTESAAFVSRPFLYPLIIFKGLRIVVGNGVDPSYSSNVFAAFGIILCSMGDIDGGYRFGKLGEEMLKRSRVKDGKTKLLMVTNTFIRHWKEHIKETLKPLLLAYESRLETGDIEYAFYAAMFYCSHLFSSGKKLKEVEKERYKFREAAKELNQDLVSTSMNIHHQMVLNLLNPEELSTVLCGTSFDEESMLPHLHKKGNQAALLLVYGMKLILSYLAGFYREALDFSRYVVQYINASRATFSITIYNFYESLTLLALGENIKKVTKNQKKMKKWAFHAPMNHLQKWHLVEAEKARVLGSDEKAKEHYKEAIKNAKENEFIQDEALGYELYARFLLRRGEEEFAAFIMRKAYYCYAAWGAAAKLTQLKEKYPGLLAETAAESGRGEETKRGTSESLDISSIIKTTQTISGEIVLEELLKKTIAIALENAGAQKGFFIIKSNELLTIEVQVDNAATTVFKSIPVDESGELARSIVQYVSRTGNDLILNDAANDTRFAKDSYIVKNKPRSILCASITHKGKTSGILYLENNLAPHAFTPERLELLRIFSAQAAISIENASLYQNLEKKVKDRTVELEKANEKLKELDKLKTGFFTNISHDIRTPLTLILTPVESALQGDYKKDVDENFLKNIQRNGIRLLKLINNLLDFAKIE